MKIAVLYSGHIRTWDECKFNQEENFYTPETDSYFYTYDKPQNTNYKQFIKIPGTYYDKVDHRYDSNKNPITCTDTTLQIWHNLFIGFNLVPMDYDIYVKSRCDIILSGKIKFEDYTLDNTIYIPYGNDHCGGINDQFAFGNYEVMKKYFSIYLEHQNLFKDGLTFHTEYYVTKNIERQGIKIVRLDITNMIIREKRHMNIIMSENPKEHWGFLNPKGKVVLDLGCGRTWDQNPTTPEYFLQQGASKVIGVEMWDNERIWYEENVKDERLKVRTELVDSKEKILNYLKEYNPEVIKCDIEGAEINLERLSPEDFSNVSELAIEYHSPDLKLMIETRYQIWGFNNLRLYSLNGFDMEKQGVIYLWK